MRLPAHADPVTSGLEPHPVGWRAGTARMGERVRVRRAGQRQVRGALAGLLTLVSLGAAAPAASAPPAAPVAVVSPASTTGQEGLRTSTRTTYRLDPANGVVEVAVQITLTNDQPDIVEGGYISRFYLDRFGVPVLGEADGFSASRDGRPLPVTRVPTAGVPMATATIDLVPNLFAGETQVIDLAYRIPSVPPRSEVFSRVNPAFVTFPVFAVGDPGDVYVEVIVPKALEVELVGSPMERSDEGDAVVFRAGGIDPETFLTHVVARDDDALVSVPVTFGGHRLTVLGWPGDGEWAQFVGRQVGQGVPALEDLIGLPWPGEDDLEVIETASPYLYGYAGWYRPSESLVEIGDELDARVILHELSHLWFNQRLFEERWINEGFAEVFASLALGRVGEPVVPPSPIDAADPGRIALLEWSDPDLTEPISDVQEAYGYNASYAVLEGIAQEIGEDALSEVIVAAEVRDVAYQGDGEPLRYSSALGWRELLDLLEEVGGSTTAATAFAGAVVPDDRRAELDARAAARSDYAALLDAGEGWSAPRGVRQAMAHWAFPSATSLMEAAGGALAVRDDVIEVLARVDVPAPAALEDDYEAAMDVEDLEAGTEGAVEASTEVAEAVRAEREASGPLVAVGMLGGGADGDLADARAELDAGDYERAAEDARAATAAYEGAATAGATRVGAAAGVLAAGLLLRRRHRRVTQDVPPEISVR